MILKGPKCKRCSENSTLVKLRCSNGSCQVKYQCVCCQGPVGNPMPHGSIDINILPWATKEENRRKCSHTMAYGEYLGTTTWQDISTKAKQRDGYRCRLCNSSDSLVVHHRTYERRGSELEDDLTTLCRMCHAWHHSREKWLTAMELFKEAGLSWE